MLLELLPLVAVGLVAGSVGALLGVGGGIILVPGLIFFAGLSFHAAVGVSLVCVVATSVAGSIVFLRKRRVDLEIAMELQFFTVVGAVLAGLVAGLLPAQPLYLAFAALLAATAVRMWPWGAPRPAPERRRGGRRRAQAASVGAGAIAGLLGVGGGILNVPILHLFLRLPFDRAVATSVYIIGITTAAASGVYVARGDIQATVAGATMLGALAGASVAATVGDRFGQRRVKMGFTLLLLYVAGRMVLRGLA